MSRTFRSIPWLLLTGLVLSGCGKDAPTPPDTTTVDTVTDTDGDALGLDGDSTADSADVAPYEPPSPLQATGMWVDRWAKVGLTLPVDAGIKGTREPHVGNGLFADLEGDGDIDLVFSDGIGKVWVAKAAVAWNYQTEEVLQTKEPTVYSLAVTDAHGKGQLHIIVGGNSVHYLVPSEVGGWVDEAEKRGIVVEGTQSVRGVTPVDLDLDGLLDLAVATMSCDGSGRVHVFVNQGDGTYVEQAVTLGIAQVTSLWGVFATDVDDDGLVDLLSMPETCEAMAGGAWLHHQGFKTGAASLTQSILKPLFLHPEPSASPMGGSVGDVDNDGDLDYVFSEVGMRTLRARGGDVVTPDLEAIKDDEVAANHLLINDGKGHFKYGGVEAGITVPLSSNSLTMTSWSVRMLDFDHDGHLDMMFSHGHDFESFLLPDEGGMRPALFRNNGDATFTDVSALFGLPVMHLSRAMATADADGDGDLDLFFGGQTMQPLLLENQVEHKGTFLRVRLKGTVSNPWGIGARLKLVTKKHTYVAEMTTNSPTETMDEPVVTFGLPKGTTLQQLEIRWPSGFEQIVDVLKPGKELLVEEPHLVELETRWSKGGPVQLTLRAFDSYGGSTVITGNTFVEMVGGGPGKWIGSLECSGTGSCKRIWMTPNSMSGETVFEVTLNGKALRIRPKIRFGPLWGQP